MNPMNSMIYYGGVETNKWGNQYTGGSSLNGGNHLV